MKIEITETQGKGVLVGTHRSETWEVLEQLHGKANENELLLDFAAEEQSNRKDVFITLSKEEAKHLAEWILEILHRSSTVGEKAQAKDKKPTLNLFQSFLKLGKTLQQS